MNIGGGNSGKVALPEVTYNSAEAAAQAAQFKAENASAIAENTSIFSGLTSTISSIAQAYTASQISTTYISGGGSAAAFGIGPSLTTVCFSVTDEDNANHGRPYCKRVQLGAIPGYILCENAHCTTFGTEAETEAVNSFLNTGFYMVV